MKNVLVIVPLLLLSLTSYSQSTTSDSTFHPAEVISDSTFRPTKADRRILSDVGDGVLNSKGNIGSADIYGTRIFKNLAELRRFNNPRPGIQYWVAEKGKQGWFEFDATNNMTDDNLNIIVLISEKRMKRIVDPTVESSYNKINSIPNKIGSSVQFPSLDAIQGKFFVGKLTDNLHLQNINNDFMWDLSPLSNKWIQHDILAFGNGNPIYEITSDRGNTWTTSNLPLKLFQQKQIPVALSIKNTIGSLTGFRLTYTNNVFSNAWAGWLVMHTGYSPSNNVLKVLVEHSSNGTTWTATHTSIDRTSNQRTAGDLYRITPHVGGWIRTTIVCDSSSPVDAITNITALRMLTTRSGDQGFGDELQLAINWDEKTNLLLKNVETINPGTEPLYNLSTTPSIVGITSTNKVVKYAWGASTISTTDSKGGLVSRLKDVFKAPLYVDENYNLGLQQINRSAMVKGDTNRSNLKQSMKYSYQNNGTYGFEQRQAGNDTLIRPVIINGKNAVQFSLYRSQTATKERSELLSLNTIDTLKFTSADRTRWFGDAIYVDSNFRTDNDGETTSPIVFQFHDFDQTKANRSPSQYLLIANNHWVYGMNFNADPLAATNTGMTSLKYDLGPVNIGKFTKFVICVKWQNGANADGFVKVWKDGILVLNYMGLTTFNDPQGRLPYLKFGIYNYRWGSAGISSNTATPMNKIVVYHADTRYGFSNATYEDIAPDDTFLSNNRPLDNNIRPNFIEMFDSFTNQWKQATLVNGQLQWVVIPEPSK